MLRRFLLVMLPSALLALAPCQPAQAQSPPNSSPRAAAHDGYGRMVFDWDSPVNYSADIINGELVLRFDRPVKGEFRGVLRPLSKYLRSAAVSADRKTATFPLARPVQVKAFQGNNNAVVIDLLDLLDPNASVPPDEEPPPATPRAAAPPPPEGGPVSLLPPPNAGPVSAVPPVGSPGRPPGKPPAPASADPPSVEVRAGEHGTYNRLVFDWPRPVDYRVDKQGGRATIAFARPGRLDLAGLQAGLPSDISVISADPAGNAPSLVLGVPQDARLRHFTSGNKVVVDVVRAAGSTAPTGGPAPPLAPPPGTDVTLPALQPLVREEQAKLPSETLAPPPPSTGPSPIKPIPEPKAKAKPASATPGPPSVATPVAAPATPAAAAQPVPAAGDQVFSLSVPWDKPVAAAVFQRAGYLWLVFDRYQEVDTKLMHRLGGEAVISVDQFPNKEATVLRLVVQPEYVPSVRRDGLLWVVDLMHQSAEPKAPITITAPASLPTGIGMELSVADAGNVVGVHDPEVGDIMTVVPVIPLGAGIYPGRSTLDLDLLPTTQGVAILSHVDGLDVKSSRGGITIGLPSGSGLRLSAEAGKTQVTKNEASGGFFDVPEWMRGGADNFQAERRLVEGGLVDLPAPRRAAAHLQAARFFFANGYAAEALGYLRMAATDEPGMVDTGAFRAVRGACQLLMGHWDLAQADLDSALVKDDAESQFWRAAAHVATSAVPGGESKALALGLALLKEYPHALKWPLAGLAATAAVAAGDDETAQTALDVLDRETPSKAETGQLDYLHGTYDEMIGQFDRALEDYDRAADGDNREFRAKAALASTELQLKLKKITPKEAADKLDRLRFAWREEDFEFGLLRRFAELQLDAGDYPSALRALRSEIANYPDNKDTPKVSKMMTDIFARLYLDGAANALPPVSAIGLFDEFRELTPAGPKGDEMIRKLADRLTAVDLLDRAAELLKHQVTYRLQGLDKARVGSQLALVDLLNREPQQALDALQTSEMTGMSPELQQQRRHLKARALADVDRVPEAIQLLVGDETGEAAQLRAEIHWRKKDWLEAAAAFEGLVSRPERGATLDDASARLVLSWATALNLGNDERSLAVLRRNFGPAMAMTPYKDGFSLLTSAIDRELPDMPAVAAKIKEAEGFQTFMSDYKKRVRDAGLSSIN